MYHGSQMLNLKQKFWCEALYFVKERPIIVGSLNHLDERSKEDDCSILIKYLESQIVHFSLNAESEIKI